MRLLTIAALAVLAADPPAGAAVNVVATTEDLADLTRQVGGDRVKVETIARGYQDPHFVEAKPSFILTYRPSEFSLVRAQYRRTTFGQESPVNELLFQFLFAIGAHGAHPF